MPIRCPKGKPRYRVKTYQKSGVRVRLAFCGNKVKEAKVLKQRADGVVQHYNVKDKKQKVYELTTNKRDGYSKWYVRGIESDEEARRVAKAGFGPFYEPTLISYYDDYPSHNNYNWKRDALTVQGFMKATAEYREKRKTHVRTTYGLKRYKEQEGGAVVRWYEGVDGITATIVERDFPNEVEFRLSGRYFDTFAIPANTSIVMRDPEPFLIKRIEKYITQRIKDKEATK